MRYFLLLLLYSLLVGTSVFGQADLKKLDAYYAKALREWNVPGMSIGIVKDGKIIFSKGYGVKQKGRTETPDGKTLYAIASNTKAFTSAAIGQLVDEGKVSWDDKVVKYLPYFALYDPWVSQNTTIRDLLCHRVGLRTFSGDILWYRSTLSAEEIIRRVRYLPKAYDFRAGYGYSNVMYLTAGEVLEHVTGQTWHEYIHDHFFQPLGMRRSITTIRDLDKVGNYASPHKLVNDEHEPMAWEEWATVAAMGGIISSVEDMAQWMILNLNNGNDMESVIEGLEKAKTLAKKGKPVMNLMKTDMGFGVDFMMGSHKWHGVAPNEEELKKALAQLEETLGDY